MKLSKAERAILANQNRILSFLDTGNRKEYLIRAEIAEQGYEGLYEVVIENINFVTTPSNICRETMNILDMYHQIENVSSSLTAKEKKTLDLEKIRFEGFDAEHDKHYKYMKFLITKSGIYQEYKNRIINSRSKTSLLKYKKMLRVFKVNTKETDDNSLTLEGLQKIINAV